MWFEEGMLWSGFSCQLTGLDGWLLGVDRQPSTQLIHSFAHGPDRPTDQQPIQFDSCLAIFHGNGCK